MPTLKEIIDGFDNTVRGAKNTAVGGATTLANSVPVLGAKGLDAVRTAAVRAAGGTVDNPNAAYDAYTGSSFGQLPYRLLDSGLGQTRGGVLEMFGGAPRGATPPAQKAPSQPGQPRPEASAPAANTIPADVQRRAMANQDAEAAFQAKPATAGQGYGANTGNIVPSEFFTGGAPAQPQNAAAPTLPQPQAVGGVGGGQASFIADPGGKLTPGSRMFDPAAFKAQLAQDQVDAQRDVAGIQANAGLAEADLAGQYGVLGGQLTAQSAVAGGAMDHQRAIELEAIKAELAQESPLGQMQRATAMTQLQRQQMIAQGLESGQVTLQDLLTDQTPAGAEVVYNAAGIPMGYSRGGETVRYPDEIIQSFVDANAVAQGIR